MANQINRIPLPSQLLVDVKSGIIDQYWYDYLQSLEGRTAAFEARVAALEAERLFRPTAFPTRIWIDIVGGDDANDGLTAATAIQHPQAAIDMVIKNWHLNNRGVEFFYRWRDDSLGNPIEYPGAIWAYPFLGSPHDLAISVRGETDSNGSIRVRIADGISGCIHAAEAAQVYVYNIGVRSTAANVAGFKAAYNGKLFLNNVICWTGGGAMIEASPRNGTIDIDGDVHILVTPPALGSDTSFGLTNTQDGGSIVSGPASHWRFNGNPKFSYGVLNADTRSRQQLGNIWDITGGSPTGRKWTLGHDAMFYTSAPSPGAAGLDFWVPGTLPGAMIDGGSWHILT